ncbi:CG31065 [Drosophila busckii]|uniref:CG31065 n=1 Tax=Drosophila busckii TaxID=30019 RepID=A0A0M4EIC4_DROBS|nr:pickpocket protein 19 [Drosophila busckii]ALC46396.1 CG31065 [Drosophila busckii]
MNWIRYLPLALKGLFYVVTLGISIPFIASVSRSLLKSFVSSSVSFNLDTIYLNWNTTFPAITVCELYNSEKIWDLSDSHFGIEHELHIDDFISDIAFFRGICISCENCHRLPCPDNFTMLLEVFRSKCHELIIECSYLNHIFDCCDQFLPLHTEYGVCYSFNSNQAHKSYLAQYKNNRQTGAGHLKFHAAADIQLHVHAPIDIPFPFAEGMVRDTVLLGSYKEIILNVIEVYNHESVNELSPEQRRCRYSNEHLPEGLGLYEFYSYSGCIIDCTVAKHLLYCNCTSHFMAMSSSNLLPVCDYRGLICLTNNHDRVLAERKSCECMSSCEEPEYNIIHNTADDNQEAEREASDIHVALIELPTQRYVRRVAKSNLDLLIAVGGLVSLFFNTSLLRILEGIYLCFKYRKVITQFAVGFLVGTFKYLQILTKLK